MGCSRIHASLAGLALAAAIALGADASAAGDLTGTARFYVAGTPSRAAHAHFDLPSAYGQVVGALEGNPAIGRYRRHVTTQAGTRCDVELSVIARGHRTRLRPRNGVLTFDRTRVRVRRSGRTGRSRERHWYVGETRGDALNVADGDRGAGVVVFPVSQRWRTSSARWAAALVTLEAYPAPGPTASARARRDCDALRRAAGAELAREVRSLRLVAGRAHATAGARLEPAAVR